MWSFFHREHATLVMLGPTKHMYFGHNPYQLSYRGGSAGWDESHIAGFNLDMCP